jgi:hypothetical protein
MLSRLYSCTLSGLLRQQPWAMVVQVADACIACLHHCAAAPHTTGHALERFPMTLATEFKRPTPLPARLQAVVSPDAAPKLQCAILTRNGEKEVIVGALKNVKM